MMKRVTLNLLGYGIALVVSSIGIGFGALVLLSCAASNTPFAGW